MRALLPLLLVACNAPPIDKLEPPSTPYYGTVPDVTIDTTTTLPEIDECGDDPLCTNLWELPYHWTVDGWVIGPKLADFSGDGVVDALLEVSMFSGELRAFIIFGPLERDVHLPEGADVELVGAINEVGDLMPVGDFDGDGYVDVAVDTADIGHTVYPGPFLDPSDFHELAPIGWIPRGDVVDLDRDGDAEVIEVVDGKYYGLTRVLVHDGPFDPTAPPLMTIDSLCDNGDYEYYGPGADWDPWVALRPTDMDGDGVLDLPLISEWGCFEGSGNFTVSGAARGDVDETSPGVLFAGPAVAVGDVDGDGEIDAFLNDYYDGAEPSILAGPLRPTSQVLGEPGAPVSPYGLYPLSGGRVLTAFWVESPSAVIYDGVLSGQILTRWPLKRDWSMSYFAEEAPRLVFFPVVGEVAIAVIEP